MKRDNHIVRAGAVALALSAVIAACNPDNAESLPSSSIASGPTGTTSVSGGNSACAGQGRAFFDEKVLSILDDGMGKICAECHSGGYKDTYYGPDFLGASTAEFYDKLTGNTNFVGINPQNSRILTKNLHTGPAFLPAQAEVVKEWLTKEAADRFGDCTVPTPTGPSCEEVLAEFSACMTLEDWTAAGMQMVGTQDTTEGPCFKCHNSGVGGNYMTQPISEPDIQKGFDKMRKPPPLYNLVECDLDDTGSFKDIVPSDRWVDKGHEGGHPQYILDSKYISSIDEWFKITYDKWKSGSCTP